MPLGSFPAFPTYLIPSLSFPKRKSRSQGNNNNVIVGDPHKKLADNNTNTNTNTIIPHAAGALKSSHISYLRCARCGSDICHTSQIISKGFTGRHGRAYLVSPTDPIASIYQQDVDIPSTITTLPNIITQRAVSRQLVTGSHVVADINCMICGSVLGWKYIEAQEEAQQYKVGKYIIETKRVTTSSCWEFEDDNISPSSSLSSEEAATAGSGYDFGSGNGNDNDTIVDSNDNDYDSILEFDSQDEDECDDLFAGVWSPSRARRRRNRKLNRR